MAKKLLMTYVWRITQAGPLLSLFFWSAALAGIFWQILGQDNPPGPLWSFVVDVLGVEAARATLVGLLLLFLMAAGFIVLVGYLYDHVFKLWVEQTDVIYQRNPYVDDKLFQKEILMWQQFYLPLARALYKVSPDPELKGAIERVEGWVATGRIKAK